MQLVSFLTDICQVSILYFATSSSIYVYNANAGDNSPTTFLNMSDAQLVYDKTNRQILMYTSDGNISRTSLDGSIITTLATNEDQIERFAYDGRRNVIYYLHQAEKTIYKLNLTSGVHSEVEPLAHIKNIKDLDIDARNE